MSASTHATELGAMHNLPVNAGVAGHKLGTTEAPQCRPCGLFPHAWLVQAHGRRAGVMVGCAAMVCGRCMVFGNGIAWRLWCSSRATFRMIESRFAFIISFFSAGSITDWQRRKVDRFRTP